MHARHVRRGPPTTQKRPFWPLAGNVKRYDEYKKFQGRLEEDREIKFVFVPNRFFSAIQEFKWATFISVPLWYISILWCNTGDQADTTLVYPVALVLDSLPNQNILGSYEFQLAKLLAMLGLEGCDFRRTLLEPGTMPLPECLLD
ncbi:hypothetical protein F4801DRAFT_582061 [Xylaria longipes]|nr:hypothetical protein F4801DRAFT_582061 [Xylaria longipes]